jgi:hypothetical protein
VGLFFFVIASAILGAKDMGNPRTVAMKPQNFMKSRRETPFIANLSGTSMGLSIMYLLAGLREDYSIVGRPNRPTRSWHTYRAICPSGIELAEYLTVIFHPS